MKIKIVPTDSLGNVQYQFWCEGCGKEHAFELLPDRPTIVHQTPFRRLKAKN